MLDSQTRINRMDGFLKSYRVRIGNPPRQVLDRQCQFEHPNPVTAFFFFE